MALANKKYERIFSKTGSDADKISTNSFNEIKEDFDENRYLEDTSQFSVLGPVLYQLQQMQDELDALRAEISTNKDKATFPGFGTSSTTALAGNTTTISTSQASAITNALPKSGGTMTGTLTGANISADLFLQKPSGKPRNNLGDPTVTEMALFEEQFGPKTTLANNYDDLSDLTFWGQETSSSSWVEITSYSDTQKRRFLRTNSSSVIIPSGHYKFRVEFTAKSYTFANAMYTYWSSNSHNSQVHIWKRRCSDNTWIQHTSSTQTISSWPGHGWLPFSSIPWHETNTTSTGHYNAIRVEFTPNWSTGSNGYRDINLYGMQIWGGYPKGRRTPHYYDENGEFNFLKSAHILDGNNLNIGTGNDLQIYHNGSHSVIAEVGTGDLYIKASNNLILESSTGENYFQGTANSSVSLYYDNVIKLQTTSTGVNIVGNGGGLGLVGTDHIYTAWYPGGLSSGRKAYMGFAGGGHVNFTLANETSGANINFVTNSGTVNATGDLAVTGNITAPTMTLSALPTRKGASGTLWNNKGMVAIS